MARFRCPGFPAHHRRERLLTGGECGDNCYLRFTRPGSAVEAAALCHASACAPWVEWQELPRDLLDRRVQVVLGTGEQVNADGEVMSSGFPAVIDPRF